MAPAHQSITENATVQHVLHLSQNATRCSIRSQSCGSDCGQKGVIKSCLVERHAQERTCLPEKFPYTVFLARCSEKTDKRYRSNWRCHSLSVVLAPAAELKVGHWQTLQAYSSRAQTGPGSTGLTAVSKLQAADGVSDLLHKLRADRGSSAVGPWKGETAVRRGGQVMSTAVRTAHCLFKDRVKQGLLGKPHSSDSSTRPRSGWSWSVEVSLGTKQQQQQRQQQQQQQNKKRQQKLKKERKTTKNNNSKNRQTHVDQHNLCLLEMCPFDIIRDCGNDDQNLEEQAGELISVVDAHADGCDDISVP